MKCLENLEKCNASCCRSIYFDMQTLTEDLRKYYQYHGCIIKRNPNRQWRVHVPLKCQMLTEDNLCKVHGTRHKPDVCSKLDEGTKSNFGLTEGCLLHDKR